MRRFFKKNYKKIAGLLCIFAAVVCALIPDLATKADTKISLVALSEYRKTLPVGGEFYLIAITSTGKQPSFKSSDSKIASVNTYGLVTAKKKGTCKITAYIKNAEASCKLTVSKTSVELSKTTLSLENTKSAKLSVKASTNGAVKWKSSKTSIASVDENGNVTAKKPGTCDITATVDGTTATCKLTVKLPTVKLSDKSICLFRNQTYNLMAEVSSGKKPTWKSSKKSVATVTSSGRIKAVKHGEAVISATVDGVTKECFVRVESPEITMSETEIYMSVSETHQISASVSSGNKPEYSSSNINIVMVDENGLITARDKGKAYIYAKEDGSKVSCIVHVQ